jgi:hypothetical protein
LDLLPGEPHPAQNNLTQKQKQALEHQSRERGHRKTFFDTGTLNILHDLRLINRNLDEAVMMRSSYCLAEMKTSSRKAIAGYECGS